MGRLGTGGLSVVLWLAGMPAQGFGQAGVPAAYQPLYSSLQAQISSFRGAVEAQWNGSRPPVNFSAALYLANANRGTQLLAPNALNNALLQASHFQALGVQAVTVQIGYPLLDSRFLQFNGDPGDYLGFLSFYQQLVAQLHRSGLKVIVESSLLLPSQGIGSGLNLSGYYATLSNAQYLAGRAQMVATVAQKIRPDYLSMGSEPDTEAAASGKSFLNTPSGWASLMAGCLSQLNAAGVSGMAVGAGIGSWTRNGAQFVQSLAALNLNFIDLHVYPVNFSLLNNAIALAGQIQSLGKQVAMSQAWLMKVSDTEVQAGGVLSSPALFARNTYSFWTPLDQQFLGALVEFSYWKKLQFFTPFWTCYFFAYLDYSAVQNLDPADVNSLESAAAFSAMGKNLSTATAISYAGSIAH